MNVSVSIYRRHDVAILTYLHVNTLLGRVSKRPNSGFWATPNLARLRMSDSAMAG